MLSSVSFVLHCMHVPLALATDALAGDLQVRFDVAGANGGAAAQQTSDEAFAKLVRETAPYTGLRSRVSQPKQGQLSLLDVGSPTVSFHDTGNGDVADVPASLLRQLFPKPHMAGNHWDSDSDPVIDDMESDADEHFATSILPMIHELPKLRTAVDDTPTFCAKDVQKICPPNVRSPIHCLGQHQHQVSDVCLREVEKAVPFRCSTFIDKYCDLLDGGILECLNDHIRDVDQRCKDSVLVTRRVIAKSKTHKASVVDPVTGKSSDGQSSAGFLTKLKRKGKNVLRWLQNIAMHLRIVNLIVALVIVVAVLIVLPKLGDKKFASETLPLIKSSQLPVREFRYAGPSAC